MPLLDVKGLRPDPYVRIAAGELSEAEHVLVGLDDLPAALAARSSAQQIGLEIANTARLPDIRPHLGQLDLVAIAFPAFNDGRAFSLARQVREAGFKGAVRAVGPVIADQFTHLVACGFDEVEVPEALAARQPAEQWQAMLASYSATYQRGYGAGASILDRRRGARGPTAGPSS
ncbi:MAG: DUF934 domain-containing protein [Phreatobacter sp.]|nr:DUF934 domain-containing protein [Phreatobacter sp.]